VRGELFHVFEDPLDKAAGGFRLVESDLQHALQPIRSRPIDEWSAMI
jgi:hypothetical protein